MGRRTSVVLTGLLLATVVALHPPWTARAILSRMDYRGFPAVPPTMVTDTATWRVPLAPVYSPPTLDLKPGELARYQRRLTAGDTSAAGEWQRRMEAAERRYRVPAKLRSKWVRGAASGSPSGFAFRRSIVSSSFEIDRARFGIHLLAICAVVLMTVILTRERTGPGAGANAP